MSEWMGRYRILRPLGEGGMGRTFLGEVAGASGFTRRVVLKVVKDELNPSLSQALLDEARLAALLVHRNIVPVLDLEESGERRLVVLEHIDGMDLRHLLERRKQIPWTMSVFIASEVAAALDYAHRKTDAAGRPLSIVHRDVSPQNILLSWEGEVKLTDFGIAKFARSGDGWPGSIKGSPNYMPPEQARGDLVDPRADLFALGVTLTEAITGHDPRTDATLPLKLDGVPDALAQIVAQATAPEPKDRFPSAAAMRQALLAIETMPVDPARELAKLLRGARAERTMRPESLRDAVLGGGHPMTQVRDADTVQEESPASAGRRTPPKWLWASAAALVFVGAGALAWRKARHDVVAPPRAVGTPRLAPEATPTNTESVAPIVITGSEHRKRGALSVNAVPWARIFVDGRNLGNTPRLHLPVDAGRHHIRLVTRSGEVRTRTVDVPAGRDVKVAVDFSQP